MTNRNLSAIHAFTWTNSSILFQSFYANNISSVVNDVGKMSNSSSVVLQWRYTNVAGIPKPSKEKCIINFWLSQGETPSNQKDQSVIFKEFKFKK